MEVYLNPGNSGFAEILRTDYVDKTGLIGLINQTIGTQKKLTCIRRPRRFGKSYAAQMLCAYYDKSCDSHALFKGYQISEDPSYEKHIQRYDVIYPSGEGYADIVYLPKHDSDWPALVIELKWDESAEGAIAQILKKNYPESLRGFGSEIVLVGISYDKESGADGRTHRCRIVRA